MINLLMRHYVIRWAAVLLVFNYDLSFSQGRSMVLDLSKPYSSDRYEPDIIDDQTNIEIIVTDFDFSVDYKRELDYVGGKKDIPFKLIHSPHMFFISFGEFKWMYGGSNYAKTSSKQTVIRRKSISSNEAILSCIVNIVDVEMTNGMKGNLSITHDFPIKLKNAGLTAGNQKLNWVTGEFYSKGIANVTVNFVDESGASYRYASKNGTFSCKKLKGKPPTKSPF